MTELHEHYPLSAPHKGPTAQHPPPPAAAFKTHKVVYLWAPVVSARYSLGAKSWALVLAATADEMVKRQLARHESEEERQMALSNGHQRHAGGPPKAKAPPAPEPEAEAETETAADGATGKRGATRGRKRGGS